MIFTRKTAALFVLALLVIAGTVYAQTRLRSRGASVQITDAGAVTVTPATGQGISLAGGTNITGNTTISGSLRVGSTGTTVTSILSGTASLDFGATAAGACDSLTITVTGAADGDPVFLGIPHALQNADSYQVFKAWVSAANTVTVARCNLTNATTALSNPAAATVRAIVYHY